MKVRLSFVTNSSSSSFILAYNEKDILESLWNQLNVNYDAIQSGEYLGYIMHYLSETNNIVNNIDEFFDSFSKNIFYQERYNLRQEKENEGYSFSDAYDYIKSNKGLEEIQHRVNEVCKKLRKEMDGYDTIKKICIHDDYEPLSSLESIVIQDLKECKYVRDEH